MRAVTRVVVEPPVVEKRAVEFGEITDAEVKASLLNVVRDVVPALGHALAHAIAGDVEIGNPEKIQTHTISCAAELAQQRGVGSTGQRGFEGKILAAIGELAKSSKHDPAGFEGGGFRGERRKAGGDQIGIYELAAAHFLGKEVADIRRFAGAVRTGDDEQVGHGRMRRPVCAQGNAGLLPWVGADGSETRPCRRGRATRFIRGARLARGVGVGVHADAGADEVAVAVDVVDAADGGPEFGLARGR